MIGFLSEDTKIDNVEAYGSANTTTLTSDSVDMQGYDGVVFIAKYGTAAANNVIHAEQSSDDGDSDAFTDIADSEVAAGASDEIQFIDILRPEERYVRCAALRGTSSTLEGIWAIRYQARTKAVDNTTAGTIAGVTLVSPVAGTK